MASVATVLDLIVKGDKTAVRWRAVRAPGSHFPFDKLECATDGMRAACIPIETAHAEPVILSGMCTAPPNLHAVWPDPASLPHTVTFARDMGARVRAWAKLGEAMHGKKRHSACARFYPAPEPRWGVVEFGSAFDTVRITAEGLTVNGPVVGWTLSFLADALGEWGGTLRYSTDRMPAILQPAEHAPTAAPWSCIMPVTGSSPSPSKEGADE